MCWPSAKVVVDDTGVHRKGAHQPRRDGTARPLSKTWRVSLVQLNQHPRRRGSRERACSTACEEAGSSRAATTTTTVRNAQGDMATVSGLIDAAVAEGADLLITFSTPTLQAAMQRAKTIPIVFNYVSDADRGRRRHERHDHAPNVTGVYLIGRLRSR